MANIYKRLAWGIKEPITSAKLNDMIGNSDFLYDNKIDGYYNALGIARDSGLSIRTGYVKVANTANAGQAVGVYYTRPFLPGVRPVVITGLAIDSRWNIFHGVKGLDGRAIPESRGFTVHLWRDEGSTGDIYVGDQNIAYIAIAPNG